MPIFEYIWSDCNGSPRSKTRICEYGTVIEEPWTYDGSSTGQSLTKKSEILLYPVRICPDPFRGGGGSERSFLVLCQTSYEKDSRTLYESNIKKHDRLNMLFGFEQEFFVCDAETGFPVGYSPNENQTQFQYYCGVGFCNVKFRNFMEKVMTNCLIAELNINGYNFEVAVGQGEFQVTAKGIDACDQLQLLRYILHRTAEDYKYSITFDCKYMGENWNGSGLHTNFSTQYMRLHPEDSEETLTIIEELKNRHSETIKSYGEKNHLRLTGIHETSSMNTFTYGIGDRSASVRIPINKRGDREIICTTYLEDRRPASDADPYLVVNEIINAVSLVCSI